MSLSWPWEPPSPGRAGGGSWGEGSLGFPPQTAAPPPPPTTPGISGDRWMDG